jgi:type I restriction enzyme S subunit
VRAPTGLNRLEDLCELFADGDWIETKDQSPSGIRLIQTGNVGNGEFKDRGEKARYISDATFKRLRCTEIFEGDCLVSRLPDPVGRSCLLPATGERMITAVDCTIIRFKRDLIERKYFHYFAQSSGYFRQIENLTTGATRQRISRSNLGDIVVPRPPVHEQQRIVAILDDAFAGLATATANAQKNLKNARELFDSVLNSIFAQKDKDWSTTPIGAFTTKVGSGATPRGGERSYKAEGTPLVRSLNVHDRVFKFDNLAFLEDKQARKLNHVTVQEGDVLLNITGASIARCCLAPHVILPARVNQHVAIIRPISWIVLPSFLEFGLTARVNKNRLLGVGESAGATRQAITKAQIKEFLFSYPDVDKQQLLVAKLNLLSAETEKLASGLQRRLLRLAELKQSILRRAFSGQLTSPPLSAIQEAAE